MNLGLLDMSYRPIKVIFSGALSACQSGTTLSLLVIEIRAPRTQSKKMHERFWLNNLQAFSTKAWGEAVVECTSGSNSVKERVLYL